MGAGGERKGVRQVKKEERGKYGVGAGMEWVRE